jgi:hypothetical protein
MGRDCSIVVLMARYVYVLLVLGYRDEGTGEEWNADECIWDCSLALRDSLGFLGGRYLVELVSDATGWIEWRCAIGGVGRGGRADVSEW